MPDYIADQIYSLGLMRLPGRAPTVSEEERSYLKGMQMLAGRLQDRELYAFDASALNAAADLRVDTPERVERLAAAVLATPRKIFFECDVAQRDAAMVNLRGFFGHLQGGRRPARRFGVLVDILGNGRARMQPVWQHDRTVVNEHPALSRRLEAARKHPASLKGQMATALRLAVSPEIGLMDLSRHVGISRQEFDFTAERVKAGFDPLLDRARAAVAETEGKREANRVWDRYWRMMRLRDITRAEPDTDLDLGEIGRAVREPYPGAMFDPLEEGLHVLALLALLEVDTNDIRKEVRQRVAGKRKSDSSGSRIYAGETAVTSLSVVTLNLADRGLQRIYEGGEADAESAGAGSGGQRARHPVRRHLFLARNQKIVWRSAHWRGSLEKPVLRRVISPDH